MSEPGLYKGKHYTEYVEQVKQLKREGKLEKAEHLLLNLLPAVEEDMRINGWPAPAPWYYDQLGVIYRKLKNPELELRTLQRKLSLTPEPEDRDRQRFAILTSARYSGRKKDIADSWTRQNLTDYWDERADAFHVFAERLRKLTPKEVERALQTVSRVIRKGLSQLDDAMLWQVMISVSDDVYKTAASRDPLFCDQSQARYLGATSGSALESFTARGYVVHYYIDNSYPELDRPLKMFQDWFAAAGFFYVSPQNLAALLMDKDGIPAKAFATELPRYIDEGRHVVKGIVDRLFSEQRHFIYLDTDFSDESAGFVKRSAQEPKVLTLFRNEAPLPDTTIEAFYPQT